MKFKTLIYNASKIIYPCFLLCINLKLCITVPCFSLSLLPSSPFSVVVSLLYHPGPCLGIRAERTVLVLSSSFIFSQQALCDPYEKVVWFYVGGTKSGWRGCRMVNRDIKRSRAGRGVTPGLNLSAWLKNRINERGNWEKR